MHKQVISVPTVPFLVIEIYSIYIIAVKIVRINEELELGVLQCLQFLKYFFCSVVLW